jgi:histidinol phosphatase-like enzyme
MYASIPDTLRKLHRSGFKIVIFTNQGGIKKSEAKADEIKGKVLRRSFAPSFVLALVY